MRQKGGLKRRFHGSGQSMIELAIILPILLLLCFGAAELSHAILYNNILINMSREGANLASRTTQSPQFIINALSRTSAPPSEFASRPEGTCAIAIAGTSQLTTRAIASV